jgi:glycine cleavage system aminomethyltransferase T
MAAMTAVLRRHGATLVERHGRLVAAHFGSAAAEAAVCRTTVGLAIRGDRSTLGVQGPPAAVDEALAGLVPLADRAWATRLTPGLAVVRCEHEDAGVCTDHLQRSDRVSVRELPTEYVAIELIGPRTGDVLAAAGVGTPDDPAVAIEEADDRVELLVTGAQGPALWHRLLEAGEPFGVACVGLDALEHLAASEHLGEAPR